MMRQLHDSKRWGMDSSGDYLESSHKCLPVLNASTHREVPAASGCQNSPGRGRGWAIGFTPTRWTKCGYASWEHVPISGHRVCLRERWPLSPGSPLRTTWVPGFQNRNDPAHGFLYGELVFIEKCEWVNFSLLWIPFHPHRTPTDYGTKFILLLSGTNIFCHTSLCTSLS